MASKVQNSGSYKVEEDPSHPIHELLGKAKQWNVDIKSLEFAKKMDEEDKLRRFRDLFCYPKKSTLPLVDKSVTPNPEEECVYFCGHSLGLMPKSTPSYIARETTKWAEMGVYGHRHGDLPWALCDEFTLEQSANLIGAEENEVAVMNGLTTNLHLLLVSFYQPTKERHKILIEDHAFPSDHYCVESQIRLRGFDPVTSLILVTPRTGEHTLSMDDILDTIEREGESIAVILLPGVQYFTGQVLDMKRITAAGKAKGCYVGFDLAHAIGNIELQMHDWNVDFAAWCNYKYLCAGAGTIAGAFLHNRYLNMNLQKLLGWWSHRIETRFQMTNVMELSPGIAGYRVTNPTGLNVAAVKASLDVFSQTSIAELRVKSKLLTAYLEYRIMQDFPSSEGASRCNDALSVEIITPRDPEQRGAALSVKFSRPLTKVFTELSKRGVVMDTREPSVMRLAAAPMYNSFEDVDRFMNILHEAMLSV